MLIGKTNKNMLDYYQPSGLHLAELIFKLNILKDNISLSGIY